MKKDVIKGRGAQRQMSNRFFEYSETFRDDFLEYCHQQGEAVDSNKTQYLKVFPKSIVNKVTSPDAGMQFSLNPYQGCEHGCIYCYARNTHEYWGYGAGLDFERRILVKENASELLKQQLKKKSWEAAPIVLSGNTDCYQPAEAQFQLTRQLLKVFYNYRHPVGIITKNALITRDLDILKALAEEQLVAVNISITTLSESTRRLLEPRTASIKKRLETVRKLSALGIPVRVMLAPIIPGINSHEILPMAKAAADHGAQAISHTVVRLNGAIGTIFTDWILKTMPDKAQKVLNQIKSCHGGQLQDSRFKTRMRGEGQIAQQISDLMKIARLRYFKDQNTPELNTALYPLYKTGQFKLF